MLRKLQKHLSINALKYKLLQFFKSDFNWSQIILKLNKIIESTLPNLPARSREFEDKHFLKSFVVKDLSIYSGYTWMLGNTIPCAGLSILALLKSFSLQGMIWTFTVNPGCASLALIAPASIISIVFISFNLSKTKQVNCPCLKLTKPLFSTTKFKKTLFLWIYQAAKLNFPFAVTLNNWAGYPVFWNRVIAACF